MLGSPPKTFNPPKTKNKKRFPKFLAILILIIAVVTGVIYWLFYSSFFQIENVTLTGMDLENFDLNRFKGQNILLVNLPNIKSAVKTAHPETGQIKIVRGLPNTLKIEVQPDQASIVWQTGSQHYLVNSEGIIFGLLDGQTDLPLISDNKNLNAQMGQQVVTVNFIEFIKEISNKFSAVAGFKIVSFEVNDTIFQVNALTDQGWLVKFDTTRSPDDQLDALSKVLAEHKDEIHEYADVRVEGKVFFK